MQETAKVNYIQYGRSTKSKKKKPQSSAGATGQGAVQSQKGRWPQGDPVANHTNDLLSRLTPATDVGRGKHCKAQDCKAMDATCRGCGKKGHYEKVCLQGKHSAHSLETPQMTSAGGLGPVNPYISMMRDNQFTLTWLVSPMQTNT